MHYLIRVHITEYDDEGRNNKSSLFFFKFSPSIKEKGKVTSSTEFLSDVKMIFILECIIDVSNETRVNLKLTDALIWQGFLSLISPCRRIFT